MSPHSADQPDGTLFASALDHAWSRFNFRVSSALQILNYYLVALAIFAGAYVGALTQRLPVVAGAIGISSSLVSIAAFLGGYSQVRHARSVIPQLRALETRMARMVGVPDIVRDGRGGQVVHLARRAGVIAGLMFTIAVAGGVAAGIYALLHG